MQKYSKLYAALIASGAMFQAFTAAANDNCSWNFLKDKSQTLESCNLKLSPKNVSSIENSTLTINNSSLALSGNPNSYEDSGLLGSVIKSTVNFNSNSLNINASGVIFIGRDSNFNLNKTSLTTTSDGFELSNSSITVNNNSSFTLTGHNSTAFQLTNNSTAHLTNSTINITHEYSNVAELKKGSR
ncbi:hypothetical protein, partial [Rodentibacter caecimuris]|uniref:hypothetical protein n=1 Tax=Rodentibacter caecimuris TaxID=1796644 RepID=UPI00117B89C8